MMCRFTELKFGGRGGRGGHRLLNTCSCQAPSFYESLFSYPM